MTLKPKYFITEIQHMWHVAAQLIPVITGATGTMAK